jgi:phosphatidylinositol-3-phosphatase
VRKHPAVVSLVRRRRHLAAVCAAGLVTIAVVTGLRQGDPAAALPSPDHVVVVVFENRTYPQIIGSSDAPYISSLADRGADFTRFSAETHPSQPNYFAMFSGSTQGITTDACPPPGSPYGTANLAKEIIDAGHTWGSYNEGLPAEGSRVCTDGSTKYARKHNPWFSFGNVPASTGHTFAAWPTDFTTLPTVSFVIPNLCDDMHDCSVRTGDTWLKDTLGSYAAWAPAHNSLLIVTTDEDDKSAGNRISTLFYGAHVRAGRYSTAYDHYSVLRTIEDMYGTNHAGAAASATPITEIWR